MKVEQHPAYLLHARAFSETSLLVDIFSKGHGRLMLLAKGARRVKSRARGLLLPFKPLLLSWSGKGQLPTLTSVEQGGHIAEMAGKPLASGFYLNELVLRLLHRHDAHEDLFEQYHLAIKKLTEERSPRQILRIFEKKLLHHIGFGAVLDHDVETGEAISAERHYRYILEKGPVGIAQPDRCAQISEPPSKPLDGQSNAQFGKQFNQLYSEYAMPIHGSTLRALCEERFQSDSELQEAQRLTRMLIDCQLNGRTLCSRRVAIEMNRYSVQNNGCTTAGEDEQSIG